jgi:hypothetical protein
MSEKTKPGAESLIVLPAMIQPMLDTPTWTSLAFEDTLI